MDLEDALTRALRKQHRSGAGAALANRAVCLECGHAATSSNRLAHHTKTEHPGSGITLTDRSQAVVNVCPDTDAKANEASSPQSISGLGSSSGRPDRGPNVALREDTLAHVRPRGNIRPARPSSLKATFGSRTGSPSSEGNLQVRSHGSKRSFAEGVAASDDDAAQDSRKTKGNARGSRGLAFSPTPLRPSVIKPEDFHVDSPAASDDEAAQVSRKAQGHARGPKLPARPALRPRPLRSSVIKPEDVDPSFVRSPPKSHAKLFEPGTAPPSDQKPWLGRSQADQSSKEPPIVLTKSEPTDNPGIRLNEPEDRLPSSEPESSTARPRGILNLKYKSDWPTLALQPQSRPVLQDHLAAEVKSIYTGLTQVETKCVHVDRVQSAIPRAESRITDDHWQAMITLHRTLLHEHHDFFLASQHPAASAALKRLAIKYSMPARMWKHGIHSFLELLRHRLPESLEYMLSFIYTAYQTIALLYETVPTFRNTWIECLGDLGRYRMAVEDENVRDREIWAGVARGWYNKAADTNPCIGRLFHHLAILARPHMVQQLYLYNRSLTSVMPFANARESVVTILDPVLTQAGPQQLEMAVDFYVVKAHAVLFKKEDLESVPYLLNSIIGALPAHIARMGDRWMHVGAYVAIANVAPLFDFGNEKNRLKFIFDWRRKALQQQYPKLIPHGLPEDQAVPDPTSLPEIDALDEKTMLRSIELFCTVLRSVLGTAYTPPVLAFVHCSFVFLAHIQQVIETEPHFADLLAAVLDQVPWNELISFVNALLSTEDNIDASYVDRILFDDSRWLPEDWMLRGLSWAFGYIPLARFKDASMIEEGERYIERTSTHRGRVDRVASLVVQIARTSDRVSFDVGTATLSLKEKDTVMSELVVAERKGSLTDNFLMLQIEAEETTDLITIKREYSSLIVDCGVMRKPEAFRKLLETNLPIVVHKEAIDELIDDKDGEEAIASLQALNEAWSRQADVSIKDYNGADVTAEVRAHLPSSLEKVKGAHGHKHHIDGNSQLHMDTMINLVRQETASTVSSARTDTTMSSTASVKSDSTIMTEPERKDAVKVEGKPAAAGLRKPLLVTDDRSLRIQAHKSLGSAAIATVTMTRLLNKARKNSSPQIKMEEEGSAMDIDPPADVKVKMEPA